MKKTVLAILMIASFQFMWAQSTQFVIETPYGNMEGELYDDTPQHRDNFVKLVKEGWYNGSPFHRVINNFMIQGGGHQDGRQDPGYKVPAEILPHKHVHIKGELAAARQGDQVNPQKASSGSQFYIVQGKPQHASQLTMMEQQINKAILQPLLQDFIFQPQNAPYYKRIDSLQRARDFAGLETALEDIKAKMRQQGVKWDEFHYTPEQIAAYEKKGGTPHLDGGYTVFGRITKGLEVIDKIAAVKTAGANKPVNEIKMTIKLK